MHGGKAILEAVQLIVEHVKVHDCQLHPESIENLRLVSSGWVSVLVVCPGMPPPALSDCWIGVANEPVISLKSLGSVPILQTELVVSEDGVSVGAVPGAQIHQGTPPTPVLPGHLGDLPVPADSGISAEMKQFMDSFVASFQQARSPVHREHSYLEQLQRYKHPTFSGTLIPSEAEAWFRSIEKTLDAMKCPNDQRELFFAQYFSQSYRDACISEFYAFEQGDMSIARYDQREVLPKALALKQNEVEDRRSRDARNTTRHDTRPNKGKAVQTQYNSLGPKRQRFESTPARATGRQYLETAQLLSYTC
ncbi:hypothetical protein GIB67_007020 [Kingdonia uniflora]|uniref:Retrotransposon gag domain-containing protein n=1 Tax=Kingdonia uniflora TaxID=39325 RepID=A0A7J7NZA4_9MAGN|nr:hypothetical protein GIB67_007020 [Kingdonia uniflora]